MHILQNIYAALQKSYGPQGWWPLINHKGTNPTKTGAVKGYHPEDYSFPRNKDEEFEICIGSILTQNTAWGNVEKALQNLKRSNALSIKGITKISDGKLRELIKPAGYYNQKSGYLRNFIKFYKSLNDKAPSRDELLEIKGIGKETADSMLLYAFKVPTFVVDAYAKRILGNLKLINIRDEYEEVKKYFEDNIKKDLIIYQEYHALLVEHAKHFYSKKPFGENDPLKKLANPKTI